MYHMMDSRMATWSPCLLLFVFLAVAAGAPSTVGPKVSYVHIQLTAPAQQPDTITVNCTVEPGVSGIWSIQVGKKLMDIYGRYSDKPMAGAGADKLVNILTSDMNIIVDGHFDSTGTAPSYVSVSMRRPTCAVDGVYYCIATDVQRTTSRTETNITICNNVTKLTQVTPDFTNPTHSVITCQMTANENVTSISFMEIFWRERQLVYANTTANGGLATKGPDSFGNITKVAGRVNQTHPEDSWLVVDIPAETCVDAATGDFACVIRYSDSDSSLTQLARAELVASVPCDSATPKIAISQSDPKDPTRFEVSCGDNSWSSATLLTLELSLLPDKSLRSSGRRQIAYYGRFLSNLQPVVNPDLADKGASASSGIPLSVTFRAGTCEDTGVYRCKAVYLPTGETIVKVKVSEARLPACLPGAVASIEGRRDDFEISEKFVCRVDPSLVVELVSLEVSVVRNGFRRVLGYINSFMNDKVSFSSGDLQVKGEVHPFAPAASSLNVTSVQINYGSGTPYITSCKAVYIGRDTANEPVESLADVILHYRK